jgi:pyruvate dehydrogenase E1 component
MLNDNDGRTGVFIRGVTRGIDQKMLLERLQKHARFKNVLHENQLLAHSKFPLKEGTDESLVEPKSESEILTVLREEVLRGAYYLIDYRGYAGYEPGDNVVHIISMGSPTTEAVKASDQLLERGIYANVIVVTSSDLLVGIQGHADDYAYLKDYLGVTGTLYLQPFTNGSAGTAMVRTLSGRRVPVVSVHDGEPGLLDNIGSIVGVRQEVLAVRKHSKSGNPSDIYHFHQIDDEAIVEAAGKVLSETALEEVQVSPSALEPADATKISDWRELWPRERS